MTHDDDEVLASLDALIVALDEVEQRLAWIRERAVAIRSDRSHGKRYAEIARVENRPLIVEALTDALTSLQRSGARFRRAEAAALHAEGVPMERIAELFGVTRQRVSALLRVHRGG